MSGKRRATGAKAGRLCRLLSLAVACLLLDVPLPSPLGGVSAAAAQQESRFFLDFLFGGPPKPRPGDILEGRVPPRQRDRVPAQRRAAPKRSDPSPVANRNTPRPAAIQPTGEASTPSNDAPEPAAEKSATARTVLVTGDFMAASLASGLVETFSGNPDVVVVNAADGSSGFVRDDHHDWVSTIGPLIDERKPAVLVIMIGSNDRQPIATPDGALPLRSGAWVEEYQRRMDRFAETAKAKGVAIVWVGMPAFKSDRMSDDMAAFNELYRKAATAVGGQFVDVWDGFVDAGGAFTFSGPDIAGQQTRLRNSDGITLTPPGREKLAFFTEKSLFKLLGTTADGNGGSRPQLVGPALAATSDAAPAAVPDIAVVTSMPAISLDDPLLDGAEGLLDAAAARGAADATLTPTSHRDKLVIAGAASPAQTGRADDFDWGRKSTAVIPVAAGDAVLFRGTVNLQDALQPALRQPPDPMPSLQDAILDDWARQQKQDSKARAGKTDAPAEPARP